MGCGRQSSSHLSGSQYLVSSIQFQIMSCLITPLKFGGSKAAKQFVRRIGLSGKMKDAFAFAKRKISEASN